MSTTTIKRQFVKEQLTNFAISPRCCQIFSASFYYFLPELASELQKLELRAVECVSDGIKNLLVFKTSCMHYLTAPELSLKKHSKDLQLLQDNITCGMQLLGSMFGSSTNMRPVVPAHRFSLGPLKQSMTFIREFNTENLGVPDKLLAYKGQLLNSLDQYRVLIVNGDVSYEKSIALPLYIIEKCSKERSHCKIICVEREQLLAIYYSERLANHINEKIGNTIAFQVNLQSRISETSNLIYTTANFLLRVLMGQRTIDSFRHISHIIIDDVHMHEAYADVLLCELREAMRCHPHLRIILLSNSRYNDILLDYFGEGKEFHLPKITKNIKHDEIIYVDEIRKMVDKEKNHSNLESLVYTTSRCAMEELVDISDDLDRCLEYYERSSSQQSFEAFLYMVRGEFASVNYRHSITGATAILIACKYGNITHLRILLDMHADPFIKDESNVNAFSTAIANGNLECSELLNSYCNKNHLLKDSNPSFFDINLITDIIQMILTRSNWQPGNILVFMPNYEQICRLNFAILRQKFIGNLPKDLSIHTLHADIGKEQLLSMNINGIKIILCTDIGESFDCFQHTAYVIDSVRRQYSYYNSDAYCNEENFEWVSKECMERRSNLVNVTTKSTAKCFRLIPKSLVNDLPNFHTAEIVRMPLDRVCLTIKLLSPMSLISEYLYNLIITPPFINILHTVEELKKIQIFDEMEDVTWLGCRLIDIPVQVQLGKMLVYAILLQCLDPVLTIVSFLSFTDPLKLPTDIELNLNPYTSKIRNALKLERKRLTGDVLSDHLMYIRLYQDWQNQLRDDNTINALHDEHHFILNCILDRVCDIRTHLVGSLRSSQLIHNQGHLSMHHINAKSNSWCLIKAALVGASSNICYFDQKSNRIRSNRNRELALHLNSVLRNPEPFQLSVHGLNSPWIIYSKESNSVACNSISCCTLVTPFTVALFRGSTVKCSNIHIDKSKGVSPLSETDIRVIFHVDDFINFNMCISDAAFLLKIRQSFYSSYINYLQHCGNMDYSRRNNYLFSPMTNSLEKLLLHEDIDFDFKTPENVGLRPKSVPNNFLLKFNLEKISTHTQQSVLNTQNFRIWDKQFFIIHLTDTTELFFRKNTSDNLQDSIWKSIQPHLMPGILTYLIMYSRNPDQFHTVALIDTGTDLPIKICACFKNHVPISEFRSVCSKNHIYVPLFNDRQQVFKVDKQAGSIILYLFAFRNNLLHA